MHPFYTVIPLINLQLDPKDRWEFGGGLALEPVPAWVRAEPSLNDVSGRNRRGIDVATHAFVMRYEAEAMGDPDPTWRGPDTKSIQETKYEVGVLGNLALWLVRPSRVCFTVVLHAWQIAHEPSVLRISSNSPILCHPQDQHVCITKEDVEAARKLHLSLVEVDRDTSLWNAVWTTWAGLQINIEPIRCLLFWLALESLFGPEDAREITFRLSQRIAFFLSRDRHEAAELYEVAKKGYNFRSKIVHGRWRRNNDGEERTGEVERLVQRSLARILAESGMKEIFSGNSREHFLDELFFKNGAV